MSVKISRSPRYPVIGLREAIDKVSVVYKSDFKNQIPKELVAQHMGYKGLNGKSLGIISAVSKYGLLEGGIDAMRVTDLAVDILERENDDPERIEAIRQAAFAPDLYKELNELFPDKVSDAALRSFLITKRQFLPDSAERLVRSYRETMDLLDSVAGDADHGLIATPVDVAPPQGNGEPSAASKTLLAEGPHKPETTFGERELTTGLLSKSASFRLLVKGPVGVRELERLIRKLELDKEILADHDDDASEDFY